VIPYLVTLLLSKAGFAFRYETTLLAWTSLPFWKPLRGCGTCEQSNGF